MATTRGATFTGTITYNTGSENTTRYVFTDAAGQVAKTLISSSSGPLPITVPAMIKTDASDFTTLALHVKTTKTVSGQADIDWSVKRLHFFGGGDEGHWPTLSYAGPSTNGLYARVGGGSSAASFGTQVDLGASQLLLDNMAVNDTAGLFVTFSSSVESPWVLPFAIVGVILEIRTAATPAITTSNTWTIEMNWFYGN